MPEIWQPAYEWRLVKAEAGLHEAKEKLEDIGFNARRDEGVDEMVECIRSLIVEVHVIWDKHYGHRPGRGA